MYYYVVVGIRTDSGVEENIRTFDTTMNLTDSEAREAAMEYELIAMRNKKYSSCSVKRKMLMFK